MVESKLYLKSITQPLACSETFSRCVGIAGLCSRRRAPRTADESGPLRHKLVGDTNIPSMQHDLQNPLKVESCGHIVQSAAMASRRFVAFAFKSCYTCNGLHPSQRPASHTSVGANLKKSCLSLMGCTIL